MMDIYVDKEVFLQKELIMISWQDQEEKIEAFEF